MDEHVQQSISDDQELAKALAGVSQDIGDPTAETTTVTTPADPTPTADDQAPSDDAAADDTVVAADPLPTPTPTPAVASADGELDSIKLEALQELRPLVDKLDVAPEERFDTYLLLLRSTDDRTLIAPAHEAAKAIADEARRAQALLDIIKEIDFLSQSK